MLSKDGALRDQDSQKWSDQKPFEIEASNLYSPKGDESKFKPYIERRVDFFSNSTHKLTVFTCLWIFKTYEKPCRFAWPVKYAWPQNSNLISAGVNSIAEWSLFFKRLKQFANLNSLNPDMWRICQAKKSKY